MLYTDLKHIEVFFDRTADPVPLQANFYLDAVVSSVASEVENFNRDRFVESAILESFNRSLPHSRFDSIRPHFGELLDFKYTSLAQASDLLMRGFNIRTNYPRQVVFNDSQVFISRHVSGPRVFDVMVFGSLLKTIIASIADQATRPNAGFLGKVNHHVCKEYTKLLGYATLRDFSILLETVRYAVNDFIHSGYLPYGPELIEVNGGECSIRLQIDTYLFVDFVLCNNSVSMFYNSTVRQILDNVLHYTNTVIGVYKNA